MTQTKISKAYQTTISAEAIRALGLRPGMFVNQYLEGNKLVLEPLEDAAALAGSLRTGKRGISVDQMKAAARAALAEEGMAGIQESD